MTVPLPAAAASVALVPGRPSGWIRFAPLWALSIPAAWFAYVLAFNPTDRVADPSGPCVWHLAFGIDGPTCGITRMTWYLLHADIVDAARMHLVALALVPLGTYVWLWWIAGWVFGRRLPLPRMSRRTATSAAVATAIVFVVYSLVLRNLPGTPFTWFYVPDLMG